MRGLLCEGDLINKGHGGYGFKALILGAFSEKKKKKNYLLEQKGQVQISEKHDPKYILKNWTHSH